MFYRVVVGRSAPQACMGWGMRVLIIIITSLYLGPRRNAEGSPLYQRRLQSARTDEAFVWSLF